MKFTGVVQQFEDNLWYYHIPVPQDIAEHFISRKKKRVVCSLAGGVEVIHAALMPDGLGGWFININKEVRKKLRLERLSEVEVELTEDNSKYGMPMPEELGELLKLDDEGSHHFHQLTPGKQRNLIHIVAKYKTTDTRLTKALVIVNYLKETQGRLDFRELNEAFKQANY